MMNKKDFEKLKKLHSKCHIIDVPADCCYIRFGDGRTNHCIDDYITVRNEYMIMDVARGGRIIGIELLGSKIARKPCQETVMKKSDIKKLSEKLKQ